jgi:hypothetical protein
VATQSPQAIEIFYSYAHEDEELRDKLVNHLASLKRQRVITEWHDRKISAGAEWAGEIDKHLDTAQIILLLISDAFMASDYCFDVEVKRAMERHTGGEAVVIPIILRPVDWEGTPFSKLQGLPTDAKPVTTWTDRDEAFLNIAKGIRKVVAKLRGEEDGDGDISLQSDSLREEELRKKLKRRRIILSSIVLLTVITLTAIYIVVPRASHEQIPPKEPARYVDVNGWNDTFTSRADNRPDEDKWAAPPEWSMPKTDGDTSLTVHGEGVGLLKMPVEGSSLYTFKAKLQLNILAVQGYAAWILRASPNKQDYYLFVFTFPTKDKRGARFEGFVYKDGVRQKPPLLIDNSDAMAYSEFHESDILFIEIEARENKFTHTFNLRPSSPDDPNFDPDGLAGRPQVKILTDPRNLYHYGQFGFRLLGKDDEMSVESVDIYHAE